MLNLNLGILIDETIEETPETRGHYFPWTEAQITTLRRWYGRTRPDEVAAKVTAVLRKEMGVDWAERTKCACLVRAHQIGLKTYLGESDEVYLAEAADMSDGLATYARIFQAARRGEFPTRILNKVRLVKKQAYAHWLLAQREMLLTQEESLEATEDCRISKREGMAILGLGEAQFGRYLHMGVIRAWQVPFGRRGHHFWIVDRRSVKRLVEIRAAGKLGEHLRRFPAYRAYQQKVAADLRDLRQQGRVRLNAHTGRGRPRQRREIAKAGLLTVIDLTNRWRRSRDTVYRYTRSGLDGHVLPYRPWGRLMVFEPEDVRSFERATGLEN